jgi:hypothetical protein
MIGLCSGSVTECSSKTSLPGCAKAESPSFDGWAEAKSGFAGSRPKDTELLGRSPCSEQRHDAGTNRTDRSPWSSATPCLASIARPREGDDTGRRAPLEPSYRFNELLASWPPPESGWISIGPVNGALGLILGVWLVTTTAAAQADDGATRAVARKLGTEGVEAFQAGQFALANDKLDKAYAVLRVPTLGIWSARALVKQGKLIEAMNRYAEVTRLPLGTGDHSIQKQAQIDAQAELEQTEGITPSLVVRVSGADISAVTLRIDGAEVSTRLIGEASPVNPGAHRVEATFGDERRSHDVTLQLRERKEVVVDFSQPETLPAGLSAASEAANPPAATAGHDASSQPATLRAVGWAMLVGGGAGLALGGVAGAMAISKRSNLDEVPACADDHNCPRQFSGHVDTLNTLRTLSTIGFIAGGVLGATGVTLLLTTPRRRDQAEAALWVSPGSVELRGTF